MFAHSPAATGEAVAASAACRRPLWAKLSPNTSDLVSVAEAALGAGAEALTLTNTLLGLAIDTETPGPGARSRAEGACRETPSTASPCGRSTTAGRPSPTAASSESAA